MRQFILIFLLILSSSLKAGTISRIICNKSYPSNYELIIDVDIFESLPPQSLVKLYQDEELVGEKRALKALISLESKPPQMAYKFIFFDNDIFDFLRVNLTRYTAIMTYASQTDEWKNITFHKCEFK